MAKKKHRRSTVGSRLARTRRKLAKYDGMLSRGEYLTAPERRTFGRLHKLEKRLVLQQSRHNMRKNPAGKAKRGKRVFRSLAELPPGRYVFTKRKGRQRLAVHKFVAKKKRRK